MYCWVSCMNVVLWNLYQICTVEYVSCINVLCDMSQCCAVWYISVLCCDMSQCCVICLSVVLWYISVLCDMSQCCVVWYISVLCCVIYLSVVWYVLVLCCVIYLSAVWYVSVLCCVICLSAVLCDVSQCCVICISAVLCDISQCSVICISAVFKGLILCWRSLLPHTSGGERWSQSFTEMRSIEVKNAMIIARDLMCEATRTNNTGLNSIISWVVDLNDRKSPFHTEYSCRSEQW